MPSELMKRILEPGAISSLVQPIVRLREDGCTVLEGVECLSRGPAGTNAESAAVMFEYVRRKGQFGAVDRACIAAAFAECRSMPSDVRLFMNVHAITVEREIGFVEFIADCLSEYERQPGSLVLELVENGPAIDAVRLQKSLNTLRELGVSIAIDDFGIAHSNCAMLLQSNPDFIKLDAYLLRNCGSDPYRAAIIRGMHHIAGELGAELIGEGIETAMDVAAARSVGLTLLQGYAFGFPMPAESMEMRQDAGWQFMELGDIAERHDLQLQA